MESEVEEAVIALRQAVTYILLQMKKDVTEFNRDDLYTAILELTKITDKLAAVTQNAPASLNCIQSAKSLSFSSMKYSQVKHSGENFMAAEEEFKRDANLFKVHYASLLLYCEKTIGKVPDSKTPDKSPNINSNRPVTHNVQSSHSLHESPNTITNTPPLKAVSQPSQRNHSENTTFTTTLAPRRELNTDNRSSPLRAATVGATVQQTSTPDPSYPQLSKYRQNEVKPPPTTTSVIPKTTVTTTANAHNSSFDEWDSIERELLGTIEEDNVVIPKEKLNSARLSTFGGQSDLLQILLQHGLSPEMILDTSEEELFLILEKSLSEGTKEKDNDRTNQDLEDRLSFLEKQLLGDF